MNQYRPGDVANGHVLTSSGVWVPVDGTAAPTSVPAYGGQIPPRPAPAFPQGSQVPLPQPAVGPQVPPIQKKSHRRSTGFAIGGGVLALAILAGGVALLSNRDNSSDAAQNGPSTAPSATPLASATNQPPAAPAPSAPDLSTFVALDGPAWDQIALNPDGASGQQVVLFAEVTQFDSLTGTESFRANAGTAHPAGPYELSTNTLFSGASDILSGVTPSGVVKVWAEVEGSFEYDTTLGGVAVVPLLKVIALEPVGFYDLMADAALGTATPGDYFGMEVEVTVVNTSTVMATYSVDLVAESPDGTVQYDTASMYASNLSPGQMAIDTATFFDDLPDDAVFRIASVDRY